MISSLDIYKKGLNWKDYKFFFYYFQLVLKDIFVLLSINLFKEVKFNNKILFQELFEIKTIFIFLIRRNLFNLNHV